MKWSITEWTCVVSNIQLHVGSVSPYGYNNGRIFRRCRPVDSGVSLLCFWYPYSGIMCVLPQSLRQVLSFVPTKLKDSHLIAHILQIYQLNRRWRSSTPPDFRAPSSTVGIQNEYLRLSCWSWRLHYHADGPSFKSSNKLGWSSHGTIGVSCWRVLRKLRADVLASLVSVMISMVIWIAYHFTTSI